jgi:hypothetical protein
LRTFDYQAFASRTRHALAAAGIHAYLLALDASFNHVLGSGSPGHYQLHFWGVFFEGTSTRIDVLNSLINASGRVHRPLQISKAPISSRSVRPVVAYALKSRFKRRENIVKSRPGRPRFWDTQERPLLGLPLLELLLFLDRIGLHGRLLTKGVDFEELQRARAIRASGQRAKRRRKVMRRKAVRAAECGRVRSPHRIVKM